ncbi:hypothetical protein MNBD_GAMMA12-3560 [hydrothermal vent metagenome]|uniref:Polysaccharide biosynthesis protein C-terminal domain-containing protein n=1 Tax=hydrothermal vent metagenome TaxID=652676 RepID=A0A3B0Y3X9_9ZZZZ
MNSTNNIYKKAISHTAIYGVADIIRKIVGFLMLPIYTRYLTPADYGVVELMMMAIFFFEVFLGMRMGQAIFRYYFLAKDPKEKKAVMMTAFLMTLAASVIAYFILVANVDSVTLFLIGDTKYASILSVFAIIIISKALEEYGLIYVRVHQRAVLFLVLSVAKLVLSLSLNIYFIVFLELSVAGVVYSASIASGAMAIFATIYTFYYSGMNFSKSLLKNLVLFSYPLWIAAVGGLYAVSSVNYFLRIFSGLEQVGIYALAIKFASLIMVLVWNPFTNVWHSLKYEIYEMSESEQVYKNIFIGLTLVLSFIGLGLSLFSETIIQLMADSAFWQAGDIVPILIIAKIAQSLTSFNNFGILLKEKTGIIAVGTYINAFITTVSFFILIPLAELYGAAISILLGTIAQLLWIEWRSNKLYNMQLPWVRFLLMTATWLMCYLVSLLLPAGLLISVTGKILILILFVILMYVLPILKKEEKTQILTYAWSAIGKVRSYFASVRT